MIAFETGGGAGCGYFRSGTDFAPGNPDSYLRGTIQVCSAATRGGRRRKLLSPVPASFPQGMTRQIQTAIEQRQGILLIVRPILQPISNHRQVKQSKGIGAQISKIWNLALRGTLGQELPDEAQKPKILLL